MYVEARGQFSITVHIIFGDGGLSPNLDLAIPLGWQSASPKHPSVFTSPVLGLQVRVTVLYFFTWMLGI